MAYGYFVALVLVVHGFSCVNSIPLESFYTFGTAAGDFSVPANDDGSSPAISLNVPFPFFDTLHNTIYVNNNGDLSFTTRVSTFTPQAFPLSGSLELIAPYWADVDTRGTGSVWYRETTDTQLLTRAGDEIRAAFINQASFSPTSLFIATWDHVGYYRQRIDKMLDLRPPIRNLPSSIIAQSYIILSITTVRFLPEEFTKNLHFTSELYAAQDIYRRLNCVSGRLNSKLVVMDSMHDDITRETNTFQCVMATNGISSFVIFLYADGEIQWTTGDASGGSDGFGGIPAQVGFNAGDGIRFASVPGSQTDSIINITTTSNVGILGVWIYRVDEESIAMGGCSLEANAPLTLAPRLGNMLGGTALLVSGPCLEETDEIKCVFGDTELSGIYISQMLSLCISPAFSTTGRIRFQLIVRTAESLAIRYQGESIFYSVSFDRGHAVDFTPTPSSLLLLPGTTTLRVTWDPQMILPLQDPTSYSVNIELHRFNLDMGIWIKFTDLAENVENSGGTDVTLHRIFDNQSGGQSQSDVHTVAVRVSVGEATTTASKRQTDTNLLQKLRPLLPLTPSIWTGISYYYASQSFSQRPSIDLRPLCDTWFGRQLPDIGNMTVKRLPPCPCTEAQARSPNSGFVEERLSSIIGITRFDEHWRNFFHPGTTSCFRQATFTRENEGSGQQCCYNSSGLMTGHPGGGTVDLVAPVDAGSIVGHFMEDVLPFVYCCKGETPICSRYYQHRPSDNCARYRPPPPACVYGDPHIVTLDGLKYTFNGRGEFTLIETVDDSFTLQGRMVEATDADGNLAQATVFSAIVGKQEESDTVQFELSRRGVDALVNGERVEFEDLSGQDFNNVTVTDRGNNTLSATFSSGAYLEVKEENDILSVLIVSLPNSFRGRTLGLMGPFNGNTSDDLLPMVLAGQEEPRPLPLNSNLQQIHQSFGVTWIISNAEDSLFTYAPGESWVTFYSPGFSPTFTTTFSDPQLQVQANEICGDDQFCLYDIAATRRTDIGLSTLIGNQEFEEILQLSAPIVCDPPCENGACVANDTCNCATGFQGERCTEQVFEECDENPCQNGGICTMFVGDILCQCPENTVGSLCQSSTGIVDCNCSRNIECSISGQFSARDVFEEASSGSGAMVPRPEVTLTGKELKCVVSFDEDILELDSAKIDNTFTDGVQFLAAGSLSFLSNLGIIPRDEGFEVCEVEQELTLSSNPAEVLQSIGIERLDVVFLRNDGSFGSQQFEVQELQRIALDGSFVVDSAENYCSIQHLLYWLTTGPTINGAICREPQGASETATVAAFTISC